jgi:uncharacterized RDD family membrane protein YckC
MTRIADNHDMGAAVRWRRIPAVIAAGLSRSTLMVALACFVLPFMTMTGVAGCEGGGDTAPASYSGLQLATFTGPDARALDSGDGSSNVMAKRVLAGVVLAPSALLIVAGLVISLRRPQRRFAVLSLAGLGGAALVLASGWAVLMPPEDWGDATVKVTFDSGWQLTAAVMAAGAVPALIALGVRERGTAGPGYLLRRICAWLLDALVLLPLTALGLYLGLLGWLIAVPLACWYSVGLESARGRTLGKRAMGLMVVDGNDEPPDIRRASIRFAAKLAGLITLVGFVVPLVAPGQRGLADLIAETRVVRARRGRGVAAEGATDSVEFRDVTRSAET